MRGVVNSRWRYQRHWRAIVDTTANDARVKTQSRLRSILTDLDEKLEGCLITFLHFIALFCTTAIFKLLLKHVSTLIQISDNQRRYFIS